VARGLEIKIGQKLAELKALNDAARAADDERQACKERVAQVLHNWH
jgi:hypothetical protein